MVPVAATGTVVMVVGCGGWGGGGGKVWGLRMIGGAVEEREGGDVTVYRQDFSEEVCGVDKARKENKTGKVLTKSLTLPNPNPHPLALTL